MTPEVASLAERTSRGDLLRDTSGRIWLIRLCVATVMAICLLNWLGWATGNDLLTSLSPQWVPMRPWTALLLFLVAGGTHAQTLPDVRAIRYGRAMAAAAGGLALLFLIEFLYGQSWGLDLWWFRDAVVATHADPVGRPALATVIAVLAMSVLVFQLRSAQPNAEAVALVLLGVALFPAMASGIGYAAGATGVFAFDTTTGMAFVTATCVWLIGMAAMAVRPDRLPMSLFAARPDRVALRRLLLVFVLFPLLLLVGERTLHAMGAPDQASVVLSDLFATLVVGIAVLAVTSAQQRGLVAQAALSAQLQASEEHYRLLAENTADVVFRLRDGVIAWMSPSVRDALGGEPEHWIGRDVTALIHPDDLSVYADALARVREGDTVVRRARMHDASGAEHWIEVHAKQYLDPHGAFDGAICSLRVVDTDVAAQQVLDRLARFDDLTGLLNRGEALRRMTAATTGVRTQGSHSAVLFCDIDHFKQVNDTLGHAAGDEVLRVLAQRVRECVRSSDLVGRMGGDEVMVVLVDLIDPESALRVAEKIRASAAEPIATSKGIVHTSMSIGVTEVGDGETPDHLIARADTAMYEAKSVGRNRVIRVS